MKRILFILSLVSLAGIYSCKTDKTKTAETKKERVIAKKTDEQVKTEMDQLLQEMEATWNEMIATDDQKIDNLQTLMARIGRDKNYDKQALSRLIAAREKLKAQRYDQQGIASVAAVDAYDSLEVSIMDETYELVENTNLGIRDTIAGSLVTQIQEDDSRVAIQRGRYDRAAKTYNQYLKDYRPQLQKLGPPYNELKPAPLFVTPEQEQNFR